MECHCRLHYWDGASRSIYISNNFSESRKTCWNGIHPSDPVFLRIFGLNLFYLSRLRKFNRNFAVDDFSIDETLLILTSIYNRKIEITEYILLHSPRCRKRISVTALFTWHYTRIFYGIFFCNIFYCFRLLQKIFLCDHLACQYIHIKRNSVLRRSDGQIFTGSSFMGQTSKPSSGFHYALNCYYHCVNLLHIAVVFGDQVGNFVRFFGYLSSFSKITKVNL